jgi:sulfite exporter TauE/SafE
MGLGTSLFLIAVGAILDFAVSVDTQGFNIHTIGVILMVVGAIGVVLSLIFWSSWGGFNSGRDTVVVDDRPRRVL